MAPPLRIARHAGAATAAQHVVDAVAVDQRRRAAGAFADALAEHLDDVVEVVAVEVAVGPGAADEVEQVVLAPVLAGGLGDDLLRQDVERRDRLDDAVEAPGAHGADQGGALDQLVAAGREEPALGSQAEGVAGAADALQEGRDAAGRADLADEVDAADVDAELQRGGADERLQVARLEALLDAQAAVARQAAVVARDGLFAEALAQVVGDALREAPRVDEDERRAVGADQAGEAVVDVGPLLLGRDGLEVGRRHFDVEVDVALVAEVDDDSSPIVSRAAIEVESSGASVDERLGLSGQLCPVAVCSLLDADCPCLQGRRQSLRPGVWVAERPMRGGPLLADVVEAGEGEGEVAAALVAREGVDLVDDDGADVAQGLAAAGGGEHEVERLGRRDQDVGRASARRPGGPSDGVSPVRTAVRIGGRSKPSSLRDLGDLGEGRFEVALDVVAEGLQGRDVDDLGLVASSVPASASRIRESMPARKAARVLPEPVGAAMRTSRPERMTGQPAAWASVGAAKRRRNQVWIRVEGGKDVGDLSPGPLSACCEGESESAEGRERELDCLIV